METPVKLRLERWARAGFGGPGRVLKCAIMSCGVCFCFGGRKGMVEGVNRGQFKQWGDIVRFSF